MVKRVDRPTATVLLPGTCTGRSAADYNQRMPRLPDVVVVGAGIVGSAIAYELARRGASVELLEGRQAGRGATHASAGMLAPHIEADKPGPLHALTLRSL